MDRSVPAIDPRSPAGVRADWEARLAGYLPGWAPIAGDPAAALADVFTYFAGDVVQGLNESRERAQLAFLDTCGERRLPAQAARVPLVFTLGRTVAGDASLLEGTVVSARSGRTGGQSAVLFTVESSVTLARARLAAVYSVDPASDLWTDHTDQLTSGLTFFEGAQPVEHAIYLGHDQLFRFPESAHIVLSFGLARSEQLSREDLRLKWEYLAEGGWHPLEGEVADLLITDGQVDLHTSGGPTARKEKILGHASYWLRGRVENPLRPGDAKSGELPRIDTIRASLDYGRGPIVADVVLVDGQRMDTDGTIYPFGRLPSLGSTFYVGSEEAFSRKGARANLHFNLSAAGGLPGRRRIAWEYFNGKSWLELDGLVDFGEEFAPATSTASGLISFGVPHDLAPTKVGGASSHFIRARLVQVDPYGAPLRFDVAKNAAVGGELTPPVIDGLRVSYSLLTHPTPVDHCLSSNDFIFEDHSQTARWPQGTFIPFRPLPEREPAIYFGFDGPLPPGRLSLFAEVTNEGTDDATESASPFTWEYFSDRGWIELGVEDGTHGFRQSGLVQFVGPFAAQASAGVGGNLYRIRARLKQGARLQPLRLGGVWWNTVFARQASAFPAEPLGHSDGTARQLFVLPDTRTPVLEGEVLEVREWAGADAGFDDVLSEVDSRDVRTEKDGLTGRITAVWVRWSEAAHLFAAAPHDRVYTLERASGEIRFGDGTRGLIPPAGAPIRLSYRAGGGAGGNVPAGAVSQVRAPIAFIERVTNPRPARGGADIEPRSATLRRGPERLRHRDRALSARDFEWLALEASPAVARARCLPVTGPGGQTQRGWVTLVVVPKGTDPRPTPDEELVRRIERFLGDHAPVSLSRRIRVIGPEYLSICVIAEVVPLPGADVATVGIDLRRRLDEFLHPVSGGPDGNGFAIGQGLFVSQVAQIIESTDNVDFARQVVLQADASTFVDELPGRPGVLLAAGDHEIRLTLQVER